LWVEKFSPVDLTKPLHDESHFNESRLFGQVTLPKIKFAVTKSKTECLRRYLILPLLHRGGFARFWLKVV
jgi:hypothetical protein